MYAHKLNTREFICAWEQHVSPNTVMYYTHSLKMQCALSGLQPNSKNSKVSNKTEGSLVSFPTWKQTRWLPCLRHKQAFAGSHLNGVRGWLTGAQRRRVSWGSWLCKRDQRMAAPWIRAPQWSIVNWAPCVKATERLVCTAAAICHNCP